MASTSEAMWTRKFLFWAKKFWLFQGQKPFLFNKEVSTRIVGKIMIQSSVKRLPTMYTSGLYVFKRSCVLKISVFYDG